MKKDKYTKFQNINIRDTFRYQGIVFLKTSATRAVSQTENVKHRQYYEFDLYCPVIEDTKNE